MAFRIVSVSEMDFFPIRVEFGNGISAHLPCSEGCKTSKMRFGNDRFAVYGIVYSIASVNEFFGMTENYSRGLQNMLLGR